MRIVDFLRDRFRFRLTHSSKFPKGDLVSFFMNIRKRGFEPACIVDIGANCGKWTRKALRVFPQAEYFLVEPQIEMAPHLDSLCVWHQNVQWLNAGVGDHCGELPFTVVPDTVSSSFTFSAADAAASGYQQRRIPLVTLNHIVDNHIGGLIPDLVKIDAEGFESRIMSAASRLMGKTELFLLEAPLIDPPNAEWSSLLDLLSMMKEMHYEVYDFTSFQRRPYDGAVGLCEIAFVRQGGLLRKYAGWVAPQAKAA